MTSKESYFFLFFRCTYMSTHYLREGHIWKPQYVCCLLYLVFASTFRLSCSTVSELWSVLESILVNQGHCLYQVFLCAREETPRCSQWYATIFLTSEVFCRPAERVGGRVRRECILWGAYQHFCGKAPIAIPVQTGLVVREKAWSNLLLGLKFNSGSLSYPAAHLRT